MTASSCRRRNSARSAASSGPRQHDDAVGDARGAQAQAVAERGDAERIGVAERARDALEAVAVAVGLDHGHDLRAARELAHAGEIAAQRAEMNGGERGAAHRADRCDKRAASMIRCFVMCNALVAIGLANDISSFAHVNGLNYIAAFERTTLRSRIPSRRRWSAGMKAFLWRRTWRTSNARQTHATEQNTNTMQQTATTRTRQTHDGDCIRLRGQQDLRGRFCRAQARRPGDPARRDLRPARAQWRGQDDADQHHLRHRHAERRHGRRRRPRHHPRLPRGALEDRPGSAGTAHRCVRKRLEHGEVSAAACSASRRIRPIWKRCCATCRCGTRRTRRS